MKKRHLLIVLFITTLVIHSNGQISSWTQLESGTDANLYGIDFLDEKTGMVVGECGTILRTYDGGSTWESLDAGVRSNLNAVSYCTDQKIVIVGDSTLVLRSDDGGETWSQQTFNNLSYADLLSVDINEFGKGIASGLYQTIMTTEDFGANWLILRKNYGGLFWSARMLDEDHAFVFGKNTAFQNYVIKIAHLDSLSTGRFYLVQDYTNHWCVGECKDGYPITNDSILTIGAIEVYDGYIAGYVTRNQSWSTEWWTPVYLQSEYSYYLKIDMLNNYGITVGCKLNYNSGSWDPLISETYDEGRTWNNIEVPYYEAILWNVKIMSSAAYCIGDMGLILKTELPFVNNRYEKVDYCARIYPNPAAENCRFSFLNKTEEELTITICNSEGQLVSEIFSGVLTAGQHEFTLPVGHLSNGLYYCSLSTKTQRSTTKFNVIHK